MSFTQFCAAIRAADRLMRRTFNPPPIDNRYRDRSIRGIID